MKVADLVHAGLSVVTSRHMYSSLVCCGRLVQCAEELETRYLNPGQKAVWYLISDSLRFRQYVSGSALSGNQSHLHLLQPPCRPELWCPLFRLPVLQQAAPVSSHPAAKVNKLSKVRHAPLPL